MAEHSGYSSPAARASRRMTVAIPRVAGTVASPPNAERNNVVFGGSATSPFTEPTVARISWTEAVINGTHARPHVCGSNAKSSPTPRAIYCPLLPMLNSAASGIVAPGASGPFTHPYTNRGSHSDASSREGNALNLTSGTPSSVSWSIA